MVYSSVFTGINVYLCYSSQDQAYGERLRIHLKPMENEGLLRVWDDESILSGLQSLVEIERMISIASVALVLVSADFLASSDINDQILPLLLDKARLDRLTILPVIIGHSEFQYSSLAAYKPINDQTQPLKTMDAGEQERVWYEVVRTLRTLHQKKDKAPGSDQLLNRHKIDTATNQPSDHQLKEVSAVMTHQSEDREPVLDESAMEQLSQALLSAFPTPSDLKLFISFKLMKNMEIIAAGNNLEERVYSLVMWAYSQGQINALITGALARNPGNPQLRKFAQTHGF